MQPAQETCFFLLCRGKTKFSVSVGIAHKTNQKKALMTITFPFIYLFIYFCSKPWWASQEKFTLYFYALYLLYFYPRCCQGWQLGRCGSPPSCPLLVGVVTFQATLAIFKWVAFIRGLHYFLFYFIFKEMCKIEGFMWQHLGEMGLHHSVRKLVAWWPGRHDKSGPWPRWRTEVQEQMKGTRVLCTP